MHLALYNDTIQYIKIYNTSYIIECDVDFN